MLPASGKNSTLFILFAAAALILLPVQAEAEGSFRLPWQRPDLPPACESPGSGEGYFRPEFEELVQRLDPAILDWLERSFPLLGWQGMGRRVFTPKEIPGSREPVGFRYDTAWRRMELEALFQFGPPAGNGTLIEDLRRLDERRLITVNRGSGNLSIIDLKQPDVVGVIQARQGLQAFDVNLPAGELYLVERASRGMLVFSLADYSVADTLFPDFEPSAVLKSDGDPFLYLTDEQRLLLVRYDLSSREGPLLLPVDLDPPWLLAHHQPTNTVVLASRTSGQLRLVEAERFVLKPDRLLADSPLLALYAPPESNALFITAGGCDRSVVYRLAAGDYGFTCERIIAISGLVRSLGCTPDGKSLYLAAGGTLFRVEPEAGRILTSR